MALTSIQEEIREWREMPEEHVPLPQYLGMTFKHLIDWGSGVLSDEMLAEYGLCDENGFIALLYLSSEYVNLENLDKIDYSETIKDRLLHFRLSNFIKTSSLMAGYFSDYIVYKFIGKAKKKLDGLLNPADDK